MALFGNKDSYVGIDLGTAGIKIVELSGAGGHPKLVTYGYTDDPVSVVRNDSPEIQGKVATLLKEIFKKAKVGSNKVVAALPSFAVFSAVISLPTMSRRELASAVRWEAKKFVPMPIDEMILDWKLLNEDGIKEGTKAKKEKDGASDNLTAGKNLSVLLTAAPRNLVQRYVNIFKTIDVKLIGIETEAFALERSLIGQDKSVVMVVDIGGMNTNISVIRDSIPLLNRSIDVGGATITTTIAQGLNVDQSRAEQFKRDFGMTSSAEGNQQIPKTIEFVISSIINEIKYCFNLYQNETVGQGGQSKQIEKVVLTGGSAFLPALPEYLARVLNMRVYIGDPWSRVAYPEELRPMLQELGPRLSVAVGLAMREI
jgi:type IV pilus assembly protein PilM